MVRGMVRELRLINQFMNHLIHFFLSSWFLSLKPLERNIMYIYLNCPDCELFKNMFKKIGRAGGTAISPL